MTRVGLNFHRINVIIFGIWASIEGAVLRYQAKNYFLPQIGIFWIVESIPEILSRFPFSFGLHSGLILNYFNFIPISTYLCLSEGFFGSLNSFLEFFSLSFWPFELHRRPIFNYSNLHVFQVQIRVSWITEFIFPLHAPQGIRRGRRQRTSEMNSETQNFLRNEIRMYEPKRFPISQWFWIS